MNFKKLIIFCLYIIVLVTISRSQSNSEIPKLFEKNGHHSLLVDGKPFFILGGQAHNSSGWPEVLPSVWSAVETMHMNTLEVPIYWELIEAQQGKFDFSSIDTLLMQAREHHMRLILLWFATWKNGSNHYIPGWMKKEASKYPNITGQNGKPVDSPSPHTEAAMEADRNAFASVMRYLKKADSQHTVIMLQIENEAGSWGSVRDFSAKAQQLFEGPVPTELLKPELLKTLNVPVVTEGSWRKVFGERADEYFHAWSIARYVGQVARAGKDAYSLPMYTNAALRDPLTNPPATHYESGGPTDNVIAIWKVAAPALDFVSPDIYLSGSEKIMKVLELYDRPDNTLFVPEINSTPDYSKYLYEVLARGGIGYSPFGIDDNGKGASVAETAERLASFSQEYAVMVPMMRELAQWGSEGKMKAIIEREDHADQTVDLGSWQIKVFFGSGRGNAFKQNPKPTGKVLIAQLEENKYVLIGTDCRISFSPLDKNQGRAWQYLKVEEGHYNQGNFKLRRIINGDETDWGGPLFGATPVVLKAELVVR